MIDGPEVRHCTPEERAVLDALANAREIVQGGTHREAIIVFGHDADAYAFAEAVYPWHDALSRGATVVLFSALWAWFMPWFMS